MSSSRVRRTRTGLAVFHAPSAAIAAHGFACTSLPPNAPPMRRHSTITWWRGETERARDDLLRLGGMLRRRVHGDAARFVDPRDRGLRLEIEMLLAADAQLAGDAHGTGVDRRHVAVRDAQRFA